MKSKQVIVVRRDLNMRKGKIAAQVSHASMKIFFDRIIKTSEDLTERTIKLESAEMVHWVDGSFTKICLSVDSEKELEEIYEKALGSNLPCALIVDNGLTEFHGVKTKTCVAIGPANPDDIDKITSHLKLL